MRKLMHIELGNGGTGYFFDCPGCKAGHALAVMPSVASNGASWEFNGDLEKPTFHPSILSKIDFGDKGIEICHSFVKDGMIQFLGDCTHTLANQTVPIPDLD